MKPELDADPNDALLQLLQALPREDLDASRSERLRRRAHAELRRSTQSYALMRWVEPLLFATCGACVLARLAAAVALILRAAG